MATAVEPSSAPSTPGQPLSLPIASLLGAVYVVAALAITFYLLPTLWAEHVTPVLKENLLDWLCWVPVLIAVPALLLWGGTKIAGSNPPKGMHGGIFLMVSAIVTLFFVGRAFAMNIEGTPGLAVGGAVVLVLGYFLVRFFTGPVGAKWMTALEEQGWFSTHQYKRSLGVKVRRLTILGVLIVGGSGAWSLYSNGLVPEFWTLAMPVDVREAAVTVTKSEFRNGVAYPAKQFELPKNAVLVMTGARLAVPLLIVAVTLWVAFRAVNVPDFAEFLIATEAEMNKVSWSTRKRLAQDTVVVLITSLLMTVFLLAVDLFWGWLLSRQTVGVLPARATNVDKGGQVQEAKW